MVSAVEKVRQSAILLFTNDAAAFDVLKRRAANGLQSLPASPPMVVAYVGYLARSAHGRPGDPVKACKEIPRTFNPMPVALSGPMSPAGSGLARRGLARRGELAQATGALCEGSVARIQSSRSTRGAILLLIGTSDTCSNAPGNCSRSW